MNQVWRQPEFIRILYGHFYIVVDHYLIMLNTFLLLHGILSYQISIMSITHKELRDTRPTSNDIFKGYLNSDSSESSFEPMSRNVEYVSNKMKKYENHSSIYQ